MTGNIRKKLQNLARNNNNHQTLHYKETM